MTNQIPLLENLNQSEREREQDCRVAVAWEWGRGRPQTRRRAREGIDVRESKCTPKDETITRIHPFIQQEYIELSLCVSPCCGLWL